MCCRKWNNFRPNPFADVIIDFSGAGCQDLLCDEHEANTLVTVTALRHPSFRSAAAHELTDDNIQASLLVMMTVLVPRVQRRR